MLRSVLKHGLNGLNVKRIIAAVTETSIFGDAATFINKACRFLFQWRFFLLCLYWVQPWDEQQRAARGGEIWLQLTGMICPCAGNLTANF